MGKSPVDDPSYQVLLRIRLGSAAHTASLMHGKNIMKDLECRHLTIAADDQHLHAHKPIL